MSDFIVRSAGLSDAETLAYIGAATFIESYTHDVEGPAMVAHCAREHSKAAYDAYLAKPDTAAWLVEHRITRAPVGYALNCAPDLPIDTRPNDIELKRIYVFSKLHGAGLAATLMEKAAAHARERHAARLLLGTYEDNKRAMRFYAKHGFQTIGTRKFNVGGKIYDDIIMAKAL